METTTSAGSQRWSIPRSSKAMPSRATSLDQVSNVQRLAIFDSLRTRMLTCFASQAQLTRKATSASTELLPGLQRRGMFDAVQTCRTWNKGLLSSLRSPSYCQTGAPVALMKTSKAASHVRRAEACRSPPNKLSVLQQPQKQAPVATMTS